MDGLLAIHPFPPSLPPSKGRRLCQSAYRYYYQHRPAMDAKRSRSLCSSRPRSYAFNLILRPGGQSVPLATQNWTAYVPRIVDGRTGHRESSFGGLRGHYELSGLFPTFCGKVGNNSASQGLLKGGPSSFKARRTQRKNEWPPGHPFIPPLLTSFKRTVGSPLDFRPYR